MAELKFDPGFRVIGEYFSQIDSILNQDFLGEIDSIFFSERGFAARGASSAEVTD